MRHLLFACLILLPLWAADDPLTTLTDAQIIEVREAQLRAVRAVNARLQLAALNPELQEVDSEVNESRAALQKLVISLRPADCEECNLEEDLTWKRPAPPAPPEPAKEKQP